MTETHRPPPSAKPRLPHHVVTYSWAVGILLAGLICAVLIYALAEDDGGADPAHDVTNAKMYQHNLEVVGGKFAVLAVRFSQWFESLWHGRLLAYTVATLTLAFALVFLWLRWLFAPLPGEGNDERSE